MLRAEGGTKSGCRRNLELGHVVVADFGYGSVSRMPELRLYFWLYS